MTNIAMDNPKNKYEGFVRWENHLFLWAFWLYVSHNQRVYHVINDSYIYINIYNDIYIMLYVYIHSILLNDLP